MCNSRDGTAFTLPRCDSTLSEGVFRALYPALEKEMPVQVLRREVACQFSEGRHTDRCKREGKPSFNYKS